MPTKQKITIYYLHIQGDYNVLVEVAVGETQHKNN